MCWTLIYFFVYFPFWLIVLSSKSVCNINNKPYLLRNAHILYYNYAWPCFFVIVETYIYEHIFNACLTFSNISMCKFSFVQFWKRLTIPSYWKWFEFVWRLWNTKSIQNNSSYFETVLQLWFDECHRFIKSGRKFGAFDVY